MKRQVRTGVKTLLVPVLALLGITPALAVIDHPFSAVNANVISSSTATSVSSDGSLQYLARFTLDGGTDFYDPGTEQLSIIGKPDATNPLEASLPRSFVIIPSGCFTARTIGTTNPITLVNSTVSDLSCGVQVQLFDPATSGVSRPQRVCYGLYRPDGVVLIHQPRLSEGADQFLGLQSGNGHESGEGVHKAWV